MPYLTHQDLQHLAYDAVQHLREAGEPSATQASFTCYTCGGATSCPYVYDPYNTGGDCLASK